ncbi:hypothetical protein COLO4_18026 [Corchorus olitorius]|uniref:Uncharacterized protein n=1 Tax=Corchorus olitorius TaxID=93759 RepID=A0A1R3JAP1_9ROSI|nr:hypothetical protein COLO4_18026 [Corchorus olitorius]
MSGKRVSALTFNSLIFSSKVRSSRRFPHLVRYFSRFQSTATERWDFHSPNTTASNLDNSPYDTQNHLDYQQTQYGPPLNPSQGFGKCPTNNDYAGSPVGDKYNHTYIGDGRQRGNQNSAAGQSGNFGGYHYHGGTNGNLQINPSGIYESGSLRGAKQSSNGFHQNHSVMGWESSRNELQNNSYGNVNFRGYGANTEQSVNMQNQGGRYWEGPTEVRQNQNDLNLQRFPESQGSLNENYVQNKWQLQQNQSGQLGTNFSQYQQNPHNIVNANSYGQVAATSNLEGESADASETSSNNATVEALDGFCEEGNVKEAVEVLGLMEKQGVHVDLPRILQLMKACGEAKALQEAKTVHEYLVRSHSPFKTSIYNRILEMYSKCGSMDDAFDVFQKMPMRNLTSWDTMITLLAKNGLGEDALDLFSQFKKAGLKPDGKMFIGLFSACGVVGDTNEGMLHFASMSSEYGIVPAMEHYVAVVDMLGSTGHLDEALEFIEKMPLEPSVDVWETLMNLCRVHGHLELGDRCAELVEQLDPSRLNEQSKAGLIPLKDSDLTKRNEKKLASQSPLEVRSRVHEYRAGDTSHPENDRIYALLRSLKEHMKESGYIPETKFVLHDIDQESKEEALLAHSERLALANGLLTTPARAQIRIIKNLRVCGDCHAAFKIMSKIVGREIIMRDAKRFHHFNEGLCSCRDYW